MVCQFYFYDQQLSLEKKPRDLTEFYRATAKKKT